jgi:hypothetical protein
MRDLYLTDPRGEMQLFPDLWLNRRLYNTSIVVQFQLHRPTSRETVSYPPVYRPATTIATPVLTFSLGLLFEKEKHSVVEEDCAICYDTVSNEKMVRFDCQHGYCGKCAVQVYKTHHQACAICRKPTKILLFQSEDERGSCKESILANHDRVSEINIVN